MPKYYRNGRRSNYKGKSKNFDPDFHRNRRLGIPGPNGSYHRSKFAYLGDEYKAESGAGVFTGLFWIALIAFGLYWYVTIDSRLDTKIEENTQQLEQVMKEKREIEIQLERGRKEQGWLRTKLNDTEEVNRLEGQHDILVRESQRLQDKQHELATKKKSRAEENRN